MVPPSTPEIPAAQSVAQDAPAPLRSAVVVAEGDVSEHVSASSLPTLVASINHVEPEDGELRCLAAGVFYESKGEPLEGQLAVANVILNRVSSGRFARSVCGVLTQPSQFSFVRGGTVPTPPANAQWRTAVAIARVARRGDWANPTPGAMYFHAARVSPGWNRPRVAQLGHHIFYR